SLMLCSRIPFRGFDAAILIVEKRWSTRFRNRSHWLGLLSFSFSRTRFRVSPGVHIRESLSCIHVPLVEVVAPDFCCGTRFRHESRRHHACRTLRIPLYALGNQLCHRMWFASRTRAGGATDTFRVDLYRHGHLWRKCDCSRGTSLRR